jgi:hypothetical protein
LNDSARQKAKQTAEKGLKLILVRRGVLQGLKPTLTFWACGTTEVMPCYKTLRSYAENEFFRYL